MKHVLDKFDKIWADAQKVNAKLPGNRPRFHRIFEFYKRKYCILGIYDAVTKKWSQFDTINLTGNFRYNNRDIPGELYEMEEIVKNGS